MKIINEVYQKILENTPDCMPEIGGMLGGQDDIITTVVFDKGKTDDYTRCHYTPDVAMLNAYLDNWRINEIEFYGLFHTHFYGVTSLSKGDIAYISEILKAMPESKKMLLFPIVVMPDKKIISYRCCMDGEKLIVTEEPFVCVENT